MITKAEIDNMSDEVLEAERARAQSFIRVYPVAALAVAAMMNGGLASESVLGE